MFTLRRMVLAAVLAALAHLPRPAPLAAGEQESRPGLPPAVEPAEPPGERPAPAPAAAAVPAATADEPAEFVRALYRAVEGQRPDVRPVTAAVDPELLLARALDGLSAEPPRVWMQAARERLSARIAGLVRELVTGGVMIVGPRVVGSAPDGDGGAAVTVRFYQVDMRSGAQNPAWHRLRVRRTPAGWRIADIEELESGDCLSYMAVLQLTARDEQALPREEPGALLLVAVRTLVPGLAAALVLAGAAWLLLVRPRRGRPGGGLVTALAWLAGLLPAAAGTIMFLAGMMSGLAGAGAVEELVQRGDSLVAAEAASSGLAQAWQAGAQGGGDAGPMIQKAHAACRLATERWGGNRRAILLRSRLLSTVAQFSQSAADRTAAEDYLAALASEAMKPPVPAAHLELARFQQRQKNWGRAAEGYAGFVRVVGPDAYVQSLVAQCLALGGEFAGAERALAAAKAAQNFDTPGGDGYDDTMVISRAAVRAAQKRVDDVLADFDLFLKPYEQEPVHWVKRCLELSANVRSGQFAAVMKDKKFQEYLKKLDARLREVMQQQGIQVRESPEP